MFVFFFFVKIEKVWSKCTQLGSDVNLALETITKKADKDHKTKTHLPKMATSLSRTLRNVRKHLASLNSLLSVECRPDSQQKFSIGNGKANFSTEFYFGLGS